VIGGHSIRDEETKFGYSVTGLVHPQKVLTNGGAQPGDALVLTKAIGTGVISTAIKKQKADDAWVEAAIASMTTLNKSAADLLAQASYPVHAMTDVTGFGLIGHAREMALASNVSLALRVETVPMLPGALACVRAGHIPGGLKANRDFAECAVEYGDGISADLITLLFDPQTAGGLLISVSAEGAHDLVLQLRDIGLPAAHIGEVRPNTKPVIQVL